MMRKNKLLLPLLLALSINGHAQSPDLPLPNVPKELREPKARAAYILTHFWDGMDFSDTLRSRNRPFMEQNFANFLSVFPHADSAVLPKVVDKLVERSAADGKSSRLLADIAELYLDGRDSPMRNEEYFILFLEAQLQNLSLGKAELSRCKHLLAAAKKNRPGCVAADFSFTLRNGQQQRLHSLKAGRILLYLNDPECDDCLRVKEQLASSPVLSEALKDGSLTLLSISVEGRTPAWQGQKLPPAWLDAYDAEECITRQGLYELKALPSLYLLDSNKRVLLKDSTVEEIEKRF